jgi:hypothetical protein
VLGSTQTMGTGVNAQLRLKALHHLDVPWLPSDIEQRADSGVMSPTIPGNCRPGFRDEVARDSDIVSPTIPRFGRPV